MQELELKMQGGLLRKGGGVIPGFYGIKTLLYTYYANWHVCIAASTRSAIGGLIIIHAEGYFTP